MGGGYTHRLFLAMVASHAWIYWLDKYRLLRSVPALNVGSFGVDKWAQLLIAPCCGMIASCTVFKANCAGFGFCIDGLPLVLCCFTAFCLHTVLHAWLLMRVVPKLVQEAATTDTTGEMSAK